ncbi:MAG: hypothetical protein ACAH06_01370 [Methylophilaceae bacterium]|jgi:hypothetical protein|uniref:hypothetical protein n=1 Tax=Methylobacillus sp. MM3 TaxID=1848039 RepID=UPI0007DEFE95|nr:hypothetical protein [Methylobacillus sp. MM3]OAJ71549.1 hypothetical protein A7976_08555 [Methylobacillus sp. MM3]
MKLHQKGFLLVEISKVRSIWDSELIAKALKEYGLTGSYWVNSLCVALDELAAAGLIVRVGSKLDDGKQLAPGRLLFNWRLSEFGRSRMRDTGLLNYP